MGVSIPKIAIEERNHQLLEKAGITRIHQGKVRDTYRLTKELLLVLATDRLSIFDFVLPVLVPGKGEVLTAMTHFWLTKIFWDIKHHLYARGIKDYARKLPAGLDTKRCLVVFDLSREILPYELIFRHHIGGSVFKKYQRTGKAGGNILPPNLPKWSMLDNPIFTPSTKEDIGHDVNIDASSFFEKTGRRGEKLVVELTEIYKKAYKTALKRGIRILDTKFESTFTTLADEILTPDSSRFVHNNEWFKAGVEKREPDFLDKELVRIWGKSVETPFGVTGINNLDPKNPEHVAFVHSLKLPEDITANTAQRYKHIFFLLTSFPLEVY